MPHIDLRTPIRPKRVLHIELIPSSAWYKNVRSEFSKEHWDILRKWCYARAGYVCEICGGVGSKWPVECHEQWGWNEEKGIQQLNGLVALCPDCHSVKHLGYTSTQGQKAWLRAVRHLKEVNGWSDKEVDAHFARVKTVHTRRSARSWKLDLSYAKQLLIRITGGVL